MNRSEQNPDDARFTRRDFVKAAAVVAAPALAGCHSSPRTAANASESIAPQPTAIAIVNAHPLKIGLIGCGGRGTGAAMQALNADSNVTLTAMGDVFPERIESSLAGLNEQFADKAALKIQVPIENRFTGFDAYKNVIDSGVDVVLLAAPPGFRPLHLQYAIERNKHVFTEKPMAVDAPGLRRVLTSAELARQKKLSLVSGFCWRYAQGMQASFQQIHDGAIGELVTVYTTYHGGTLSQRPRQPEWSDMEWQLRNWWHFTWLSGDHIVEQACHSVDRLAWATGDRTPVRCVALGGRAAREGAESGHVFDHFTVIYEYADGPRAFHTCRQIDNTASDNSDYVYGTRGSAVINGWAPTYEIRDRAGNVKWKYGGPSTDMYQNEHDALFRSIRTAQPRNDGKFMCNSTMMALMGRMAAYTGQTITWEQAMNSQEDLGPPAYEMGPLPTPVVAVPGKTKFL